MDQSRRGIMIIEHPPSCDVFYFGSILKGKQHVLTKYYRIPKHKISRKSVHLESRCHMIIEMLTKKRTWRG